MYTYTCFFDISEHLNQESINFFYKGSNSKYFWFCGLYGLYWNYSNISLVMQNSRRQHRDEWSGSDLIWTTAGQSWPVGYYCVDPCTTEWNPRRSSLFSGLTGFLHAAVCINRKAIHRYKLLNAMTGWSDFYFIDLLFESKAQWTI